MNQLHSMALRVDVSDQAITPYLLDQTLLPFREEWIRIDSNERMIEAIQALRVRGAPLLGVAASMMLARLATQNMPYEKLLASSRALRDARPTAVNLGNCIDRMMAQIGPDYDPATVAGLAETIFNEDVALCEKLAGHGAELIQDGDQILTHCNTGGLATVGIGTALGVIRKAYEQGKAIHVYVDETRPLLQGARLTAWELRKLGIPCTLIADNMAAYLMSQGRISKAIVGADRIAMNGDFANKIGTYSVAVGCHHHEIPFFVAAPHTTLDSKCETGKQIPIEQRAPKEVRGVSGSFGDVEWAPADVGVYNPAFDVTPAKLVSHWMLDGGAYSQADIHQGVLRSC